VLKKDLEMMEKIKKVIKKMYNNKMIMIQTNKLELI
jgi:hypothetical protein